MQSYIDEKGIIWEFNKDIIRVIRIKNSDSNLEDLRFLEVKSKKFYEKYPIILIGNNGKYIDKSFMKYILNKLYPITNLSKF